MHHTSMFWRQPTCLNSALSCLIKTSYIVSMNMLKVILLHRPQTLLKPRWPLISVVNFGGRRDIMCSTSVTRCAPLQSLWLLPSGQRSVIIWRHFIKISNNEWWNKPEYNLLKFCSVVKKSVVGGTLIIWPVLIIWPDGYRWSDRYW